MEYEALRGEPDRAPPYRKRLDLSLAPAPNDEVCLQVRDNGVGMDEATRARVFEPFFTTKPVGRGTGLGLSISYGILTNHNARIEVDAAPDQGTTFRVYLPQYKPPPAEASA